MTPTKCLSYVLCLAAVLVTVATAQTANLSESTQRRRAVLQKALASFASWVGKTAAKSRGVTEARSLDEGIALAKQRRAAFVELIQTDPAMALAESVPAKLRNNLPNSIIDQLEAPFSGTGDFLVICDLPTQGDQTPEGIQRFVRFDGHTYKAFVFGRRLEETTKFKIPLHGVIMDGIVALDENVLSVVDPEEASSAAMPTIDLSAAAVPLPGTARPVLARMGEKIYRFASSAQLKRSENILEEAESGFSAEPVDAASTLLERLTGSQLNAVPRPMVAPTGGGTVVNVLIVRVDFSDMPGDPRPSAGGELYTASVVQKVADTQVAPYYRNSSYGSVNMKFTTTPQLYRLPGTAAHYALGNNDGLYIDALLAVGTDYVVTNYDKVIVLFSYLGFIPGSQITYAGWSWIGGKQVWINGKFTFGVLAHELGHTFGLQHANFWKTSDGNPISDNGSSIEYADPFDTMGLNWHDDPRVDFNPWYKNRINWIHDDQVQVVRESGVYRLYRFDDAQASGTLALKIAKDATRDYWVGYRRNFADNPGLQHGAYVVFGYSNSNRKSDLLALGAIANNASDPGLTLGSALADPQVELSIVPVAEGGSAPNEYLDVAVTIRSALPQPPALRISMMDGQMILSWPASAANYTVQTRSDLSPAGTWIPYPTQPTLVGGNLVLTNDLEAPMAFFRLQRH